MVRSILLGMVLVGGCRAPNPDYDPSVTIGAPRPGRAAVAFDPLDLGAGESPDLELSDLAAAAADLAVPIDLRGPADLARAAGDLPAWCAAGACTGGLRWKGPGVPSCDVCEGEAGDGGACVCSGRCAPIPCDPCRWRVQLEAGGVDLAGVDCGGG